MDTLNIHEATQWLAQYPAVILSFVMAVFILSFCAYINATWNQVVVGLSDTMSRELRHGTVWMADATGAIIRKDLRVDRPELLQDPNRFQIQTIFNQLRQLGYEPDHLEILVGDKVRVYRADQLRPICTVPRYA
jgi:hypothetical protein